RFQAAETVRAGAYSRSKWLTHRQPRCDILDVGGPESLGRSTCRPGVALSRKGAKSDTQGRNFRSTGTKARARVTHAPNSLIELKKQLEARTRELAEAQEREKATAEVLRVISSSPGDLARVFESLLASAKHLCGAEFGIIFLREGDGFRTV